MDNGDYDDVGSDVSFMSSMDDLNISSESDELSGSKLSTPQALSASGRRHSTPGYILKDLSNSDVGVCNATTHRPLCCSPHP